MIVPFVPHPLVRGGQLQTVAAFVWNGAKPLPADETLRVQFPDGDATILKVNRPDLSKRSSAIAYLLHGMGGDSESSYKLRIARKLREIGMRVVRHNHRGAGHQARLARGIYHSGSHLDVLAALQAVTQKWPSDPILMVGFSLSGTILLNLLGREASSIQALPQVKAALAVSPALDLEQSSLSLSRLKNRPFDRYYAKILIEQLLERGLINEDFVREKLAQSSLRQFDEFITAPLAGFKSRTDYYDRCSPKHVMASITCPTQILAAADDPIIPVDTLRQTEHSKETQVSIQNSGGHLGFISHKPTPLGDHRWLDYFVVEWAREMSQT